MTPSSTSTVRNHPWQRPGTLAEAVERFLDRRQELDPALHEFYDAFYLDPSPEGRYRRIATAPPLIRDPFIDTYLGAVGEHLHRRWRLPGSPPSWTEHADRFQLRQISFCPGVEAMKPFRFAESPIAFRRRMIFTEAEPLRRARMPHDDTFWYFEELRSGLGRPAP